jgi:hypothetical protein
MPSDRTFVIIGSSPAGAKTAETLSQKGCPRRLVLIGVEHGIPLEHVAAIECGAA